MNQNQYDETLKYIHSLGMYSKKKAVDLSKMQYLCSLFNNPQECFDIIHVAGTNGKGSTVAALHNIFVELGYKTGKYISPFIRCFNEKISINGCDISDDDIVLYSNLIRDKIVSENICEDLLPNEFEFTTLMAFLYYKNWGCDIVALETGLGGRLDPTNVIKNPLVSVITSISFDHMAILGNTIEKIADEKCGIIKDNSHTVLYPLNESGVIELVESVAKSKNNIVSVPDISQIKIIKETLEYTEFIYKNRKYRIKLIGGHQVYNAITAIETVLTLINCGKLSIKDKNAVYETIYRGLEKTYFPARFEILSTEPLIIFDGAHNISGVETLSKNINNLLKDKNITLICGILKDKEPEIMLKEILKLPNLIKFIAVPIDLDRAMTSEELCNIALKYFDKSEYIKNFKDLEMTLKNLICTATKDDAIICFGSLYLARQFNLSKK